MTEALVISADAGIDTADISIVTKDTSKMDSSPDGSVEEESGDAANAEPIYREAQRAISSFQQLVPDAPERDIDIRGTANIYADEEQDKLFREHLEHFEGLMKNIGLKTTVLQSWENPPSKIEESVRFISIFLFLAAKSVRNENGQARFATSLETVLKQLHDNFNKDLQRLMIFFRLRDPEDTAAPDISEDQRIVTLTEDEWQKRYPKISLIYKRGDENNLLCFLHDLKEKIEHSNDTGELGCCEVMSKILDKIEKRNKSQGFFTQGLGKDSNIRIGAFNLNDRLLENQSTIKNLQQITHLTVTDEAGSYYENNGDGRVLIIANENFAELNRRRGTRIDCANLQHLFLRLGFLEQNIEVKYDCGSDEMKEDLEKFSTCSASCAVLVFLTHGCEGRLYGVERAFGDFPNWIEVSFVKKKLSSESLANKPRLLIINACRSTIPPRQYDGGEEIFDIAKLENDSSVQAYAQHFLGKQSVVIKEHLPPRAGLVVAYATLSGEESSGLAYSGSRFITGLCWVYHFFAGREDVVTMINRVNYYITGYHENDKQRKQLPSWVVETTKKFYLMKVVPRAARPRANQLIQFNELRCSLATLGCGYEASNERELTAHYANSTEQHHSLCAQSLKNVRILEEKLQRQEKEINEPRASLNTRAEQMDLTRQSAAPPL